MNNKKHKKFLVSIDDSSILRKFTEVFFMMSIVPMAIITYFYIQTVYFGSIKISEMSLRFSLFFVVMAIIVGYLTMRAVFDRLIKLTEANQKVLEKMVSPEKLKELSNGENELAILARSFSLMTDRLEDNVRSLEIAKKSLHSIMVKVGHGITSLGNIDSFLQMILETITASLNGKACVLMLIDEKTKELWVKTVYGVEYYAGEPIRFKIHKGTFIHEVMNNHKAILVNKESDMPGSEKHSFLFEAPLICAPLIIKDKIRGILIISRVEEEGSFDDEERILVDHLASQIAVALENSRLSDDMERTYLETISALALAVDAKEKYSRGHLIRVSTYCVAMAKRLGLDEEDITVLRDAARLHDIGKIGIPDEILQKKSPLTDDEWLLMRKHPEIGESIIKPIKSLNNLCDLVRHHHEKIDGSGYPDGLKGDEISSLVRILTVADIYDALTTDRAYRSRYSPKEAYRIMRNLPEQMDQDIIELFIEYLQEGHSPYPASIQT